MDHTSYSFTGELTRLSFGRSSYVVLWLPQEVVAAVAPSDRARRRIVATINGQVRRCALNPGGEGTYYLIFSRQLQRELGVGLGDELDVSFRLDDPNHVELPDELVQELEQSPEARQKWQALTPGRQRGFCHIVASAKRPETRQRRAREVIRSIMPLLPFWRAPKGE